MSVAYKCDRCGGFIPEPMVVETPRGKRRVFIEKQFNDQFDLCIVCLKEELDYDSGDEK